ncbi:hypothetical protein PHLGIDRAFT_101988 [Phlebiopsis gigantea 11061_1 CR5-6]|uniref:glutathione transferase n=1 Tax=Phlebiopsis gigantea (strain 11061_1 CR5-6) TaxID=745531 RepID=A0A0C3SDS9_PHLG1|nr:hypothetical protein PHLGIDRAFT_101988 [Phlebiopsis gigantea 11061_1 CR5-6]
MSSETVAGITVHHLNNSRSQRILWLLEELEIPYKIVHHKRQGDGLAPVELKAIHPIGTAPIITDGPVTVAESGAIVEYLIGKYGNGKFVPSESGMVDNLFFTHYTEGTVMPLLVNKLIFSIAPSRSPFILRPLVRLVFSGLETGFVLPRLTGHAKIIEDHLSKCGDWLAGGQGPTSADFMMSFALEAWVSELPDMLGPKIKEYVGRIHERPAYQRALTKGGEYKYAKAAL